MQILISTGEFEIGPSIDRNWLLDYVRVREEPNDVRTIDPLPKPEEIQPQPKRLQQTYSTAAGNVSTGGNHTSPTIPKLDIKKGMSLMEGNAVPIVKVQPIYPRRALTKGLEGDVLVEFTITEAGSVRDVIVIESSSSLFNDSAIRAARKFRYKPRVVDGESVAVSGVRNKISFRIEI